MRIGLLDVLCCPQSKAECELVTLESRLIDETEDIISGLLLAKGQPYIYPIILGVPVMLPNSIPKEFVSRFANDLTIKGITIPTDQIEVESSTFSFSNEWSSFFELGLKRTWGHTVEERIDVLLQELCLPRAALSGKIFLDAGCGNGLLTEAIGDLGSLTVGMDYAESIYLAERRRTSQSVHFVRGDVSMPPFRDESFDIVYCSGVLHHTRSTSQSFKALSNVVKAAGVYHVWVYRWTKLFIPMLYNIVTEIFRFFVSKASTETRGKFTKHFTTIVYKLLNLYGDYQGRTREELYISAYDTLTPTYAHRHTPLEMASWYFECGFSAPTLTHWDNYNGFGMTATKHPLPDTPGVNFGSKNVKRRYVL